MKKFTPMLAALIVVVGIFVSGCSSEVGTSATLDQVNPAVSQINYVEGSSEARGEHAGFGASGGEGSGVHGNGAEGSESEGEGSGANALVVDQTYDVVRNGARLIMKYDAESNAFVGMVHNTTSATLTRVRIEVHLSNGTELGPTTPTDLAPGQVMTLVLPATVQPFGSWAPHAEVGSSEAGGEHGASGEGSESGGEGGSEGNGDEGHGPGGEGDNEGGSSELNEAAMSSPITPLGQSWKGVLGELEVSMQYDAATESVFGTVKNISNQQLCYVQAEPHLKLGTQTVGELGPEKLGVLNPGQQVNSNLSVSSEPSLAGVAYDGYVIHMEVFDCYGSGPIPHAGGEGAEGGRESAGGEGHGPVGESDIEGGNKVGDEESGTEYALDQVYDVTRNGARLVLVYDPQNNAFVGAVANTTNSTLPNVRVEVHLSNGTELGPTNPVDLPPDKMMQVILPSTSEAFDGWSAQPEVGGGEAGGEHGGFSGEGNEAGGEHDGFGEGRGG